MANASMLSYEEKREVALAYLCGVASMIGHDEKSDNMDF